jgi:YD repeat-containing protein
VEGMSQMMGIGIHKRWLSMGRPARGAVAGLILIAAVFATPTQAQISYVVTSTTSTAGFCPFLSGTWFTFEQAAHAEWAACQANNTFTNPGFTLGACSPTGYPTTGMQASCDVLFNGTLVTAIAATSGQTPGLFWVQGAPLPCDCTNAPVADPINLGAGAVSRRENDIGIPDTQSSLSFARFYNSGDTGGSHIGPAWRHSYDRSIMVNSSVAFASSYPGASATVSAQYPTAATACVSGFAAIRSQVNGWQNASAAYINNVCVISTAAGGVVSTLAIYSAYGTQPQSARVEYDAIRDDGQMLRYNTQNGLINNPPGISVRLAQTTSGFTLTDDDDTVETYNSNGTLLTVTGRAGVVQTMSYDGSGRLSGVSDSFGHSLTFGYDAQSRLSTVTRQ